jgi:hypothetical protein
MSLQSDGAKAPDSITGLSERRKDQRFGGTVSVEVTRETDCRRIKLPVALVDLSITGLGLVSPEAFAPGDRVKVRLRNDVRRFLKDVHGIIRWAQATSDGNCRFGVELASRFSALDMQLLKPLGEPGEPGAKVWV